MMYVCYVSTRSALSSAAIWDGIFQCAGSMRLEQDIPGATCIMFMKNR